MKPFVLTEERTLLLGFIGVTLVGALDWVVGFEISLLILHVVPILFVTWFASLRWGIFFSVLMTTISALAIANAAPGTANLHYRYLDLGSDFIATLVLVFMQSRLRASYERVRHQSKSDTLTGCLNKRGFSEQLQMEIDRYKRYGHPFALAYFDCDNFKAVNDTQGHHAGDTLLMEIGRVLQAELRTVDSAGRLGGDEFAVLLRETDADAAQRAIEFMKRTLDTAMRTHRWPVGFSIGVASFDKPPENAAKALALADALMYEVKRHGKGNVRIQRF
ncbi:MAG TPA: GGDEF domain-containing protein [Paucimonas sp.]|nr:GGDEF domain-containing protein [Paucimonas sp.]